MPPEGAAIAPGFTSGAGVYALCPHCGSAVLIGWGGTRGEYRVMRCCHKTAFVDIVGKVGQAPRRLYRVSQKFGGRAGSERWLRNRAWGRAIRWSSPENAEEVIRALFLGCFLSLNDVTMREVVRYLHLGDRYPFTCRDPPQVR